MPREKAKQCSLSASSPAITISYIYRLGVVVPFLVLVEIVLVQFVVAFLIVYQILEVVAQVLSQGGQIAAGFEVAVADEEVLAVLAVFIC